MTKKHNLKLSILLILMIQFIFSLEMSIIYPLTPQISEIYG